MNAHAVRPSTVTNFQPGEAVRLLTDINFVLTANEIFDFPAQKDRQIWNWTLNK
jgi:hypothetical protein